MGFVERSTWLRLLNPQTRYEMLTFFPTFPQTASLLSGQAGSITARTPCANGAKRLAFSRRGKKCSACKFSVVRFQARSGVMGRRCKLALDKCPPCVGHCLREHASFEYSRTLKGYGEGSSESPEIRPSSDHKRQRTCWYSDSSEPGRYRGRYRVARATPTRPSARRHPAGGRVEQYSYPLDDRHRC